MELNSSPLRWIIRGGAALALTAVFFTGCVITSVYPFYTAKDATYDARLVGTWFDADETNVAAAKEFWIFEAGPGQTYQLAMIGADETNRFDAQLFTLGDERFLDLLLRERQAYTAPTHLLLRVRAIEPQLEMEFLDYEWLAKLVEAKPKAIRHLIVRKPAGEADEGGQLVLTADTAELQKFIRKHLKNTNAWAEPLVKVKP